MEAPGLDLFMFVTCFFYGLLQSTYVEERGKLNVMREFDERTIWTGECVPLMASYNKGLPRLCN